MTNFRRLFLAFLSVTLLSLVVMADEVDAAPDNPNNNDKCTNLYPATGPFVSENFARQVPPATHSLHIVSYNVNYNENLPGLLKDFQTLPELRDADFILLQEATGVIGQKQNGPQAIAKALNLNYVFSPNIVLFKKDYGNAVLSRWPISQFKKVLLPMSASEHCNLRTALGIRAQVNGQDVLIFSVHLSVRFPDTFTTDRSRALQMQAAVDQINLAPANTPSFIAGDMNTVNPFGLRDLMELFAANHFDNAHPIEGWTYRTKRLTLDHAFSRNFQVVQSGTAYGASGSDHVPIWSDVTLP